MNGPVPTDTDALRRSWSAPWMDWLDACVQREIASLRARYELTLDELRGLYISDAQVDRLVGTRTRGDTSDDLSPGLQTSALLALAESSTVPSPLRRVGDVFDLEPDEQRALFVALAPELDLRYATLFAYLNDDVARRHATVDLCVRLAGIDVTSFDPSGALVGNGLVSIVSGACEPWRSSAVMTSSAVRRFVLEAPRPDASDVPRSAHGVTLIVSPASDTADARHALGTARATTRSTRVVEFGGSSGTELLAALRETLVLARLRGEAVLISARHALDDGALGGERREIVRMLAGSSVEVFLAVTTTSPWRDLCDDLPAVKSIVLDGSPDGGRATRPEIGSLAIPTEALVSWDDLVVPAATERHLRELESAIHHRRLVYVDWGLARTRGGGASLRAMFSGAPGTGKTLAAAVLARAVGMQLLTIDLSAVVSKYIGETEKNLEQVFTAAQGANAILFFDEADALFGKRSEVKDGHDRYANIEVAYLLQRMERHDGVMILATNLTQNLDEAFSRRIQFAVEFPMPDESARAGLWRLHIAPDVPTAADIDIGFLARQFALSGGEIHNAVVTAAFLAAQDGGPLTMAHLVHAVARQRRKQGKVLSAPEFREFLPLVRDGALAVGR